MENVCLVVCNLVPRTGCKVDLWLALTRDGTIGKTPTKVVRHHVPEIEILVHFMDV